jgi:hypothetical protein
MTEIEFGPPSGPDHHECTSTRDGDWIVFLCPRCPDYERRINWRTGTSQVRSVSPEVRHSGQHVPLEHQVTSRYLH